MTADLDLRFLSCIAIKMDQWFGLSVWTLLKRMKRYMPLSGMQMLGRFTSETQLISQNVWLTTYLACITGENQQMSTQAKYTGLSLTDIHWELPWQNASSNSRGFLSLFCFEDSFELFAVSQLLPKGRENLCVPLLFSPECDNHWLFWDTERWDGKT